VTRLILLATIISASIASAGDTPNTMCVKQKDGTYNCIASGKVEKEACCQTPRNEPTQSPSPKPK
jgi:hypothetical protein